MTAVKTDGSLSDRRARMPSIKSPQVLIRQVVCQWYGVIRMPMVVQTREAEVEEFEYTHSYIPPNVRPFINHHARLFDRWARSSECLDIVIWNKPSQSYRMAQDLYFKDAYPNTVAWHQAILEMIQDPTLEVWVVTHDEDDLPSNPA